jgi:hypothetical protein
MQVLYGISTVICKIVFVDTGILCTHRWVPIDDPATEHVEDKIGILKLKFEIISGFAQC